MSESPQVSSGAVAQESALVGRAAAGDRTAFDRLVLAYRHQVMNLCVRLLGERTEGEDAAQETFVKAWRGLSSFKGEALFSTWLYRIAVNTCRNRRQSFWWRLSRRAERLDAPIAGEEGERQRELPDERLSPEKDLEAHRTAAAVSAALRRISVRHRELIVLRDVQGLSYEEIQRVTGLGMGTVKSGLNRGREALRQELKGLVDGL